MNSNRYPGINPHLNSFLQHKAGWKGFHAKHISHLSEVLDRVLPEGYYTADEESLQVGIYDRETDTRLAKSPSVPDVMIFRDTYPAREASSASASASTPTLTLPLIEESEEEIYIGSIIVYRMEDGEFPGKPVTRIEVLSPANKPPGSHHDQYAAKRLEALRSGLRLVEVDYLHERRPVHWRIPSYPDHDPEATPFSIMVSDPRPTFDAGLMNIFGFGILDPLPVVPIPLENNDSVSLDFGMIYQQTVENSRLFRDILVDYRQEPVNMDAYWESDRDKIRSFMRSIVE